MFIMHSINSNTGIMFNASFSPFDVMVYSTIMQ